MAYCASARPLVELFWQLCAAHRWFGAQAVAGRQGCRVVAQETRLVVAAAGVRLGGVTDSCAALPITTISSAIDLASQKPDLACSKTLANSPSLAFCRRTEPTARRSSNKSSYALPDLLRIELCRKRAVAEAAQPL